MATKSNTLKKNTNPGFKFKWWMAIILIAIVAIIGIVLLRFSHASGFIVSYTLPITGNDPKLSTYTNQDIDDPTPNPKPSCPATGETTTVLKNAVQKGCLINAGQEIILNSNYYNVVIPTGRTICVNIKSNSTTKPSVFTGLVAQGVNNSPPFELTKSSDQSQSPVGTEEYCANLNSSGSASQTALIKTFSINGFNQFRIGISPGLISKSAIIYSTNIKQN